jgi:hypothetical protein
MSSNLRGRQGFGARDRGAQRGSIWRAEFVSSRVFGFGRLGFVSTGELDDRGEVIVRLGLPSG